ncbi:MAG: PIN domain-containing protein [Candidatus Woesearchaeota archaeon]
MPYFFDTYAIIELLQGNSNYLRFKETENFTSIFNLIELHYKILKDFGEDEAFIKTLIFRKWIIKVKMKHIFQANIFRLKNKEKKLSFTDCLGYIMAKSMKIKFLTGDMQFKDMENVEFLR